MQFCQVSVVYLFFDRRISAKLHQSAYVCYLEKIELVIAFHNNWCVSAARVPACLHILIPS